MTMIEVRLNEWQAIGPDAEPLCGVAFADGAARSLAAELTRMRVLEVEELRTGVRVRARAHVGRVRINPLVITVQPKLAATDLLELLRYAYRLPPVQRISSVDVSAPGTLLQDLIAARLLDEIENLIRGGLAMAYEARDEWLASPRGKLDLGAMANGGITRSARLPCRHHWRLPDNQVNRVLVAGLALAQSAVNDPARRGAIHRTAAAARTQIADVRLTRNALSLAMRGLNRLRAEGSQTASGFPRDVALATDGTCRRQVSRPLDEGSAARDVVSAGRLCAEPGSAITVCDRLSD